jgi:hypothetical protein
MTSGTLGNTTRDSTHKQPTIKIKNLISSIANKESFTAVQQQVISG